MHASVFAWVAEQVAEHRLRDLRCLDVGSYATEDPKVRSLFSDYVGTDARAGPNVDVVVSGEQLPSQVGYFDVVVCTEVLEHCERPWVLLRAISLVLRQHGWLLLTARGYDLRGCYPVHDHPVDLWRFSAASMRLLAEDAGFEQVVVEADPQAPGWFVRGVKP